MNKTLESENKLADELTKKNKPFCRCEQCGKVYRNAFSVISCGQCGYHK